MQSRSVLAMRRVSLRKYFAALTLLLSMLVASPAAAADWEEIGMWTGAGAASLLYTPAKLVSCIVLGVGGGLSYAVTIPMDNTDLSEEIIQWGYAGDWMIRPEHLRGEELPEFIGFDDEVRFLE